jgi:predicted molibdopterin-dependent oxidoreductase YjgC
MPEETHPGLDPFRASLSSIRDAELVVVLGDDRVVERAPIVDLWIRAARRLGAEVVTIGPAGTEQRRPGTAREARKELADPKHPLGRRLRRAKRVAVVWSGPGGHGGAELAELAQALRLDRKQGSGAFYLPATPNGRAVADAWSAAGRGRPTRPDEVGLLLISGDDAVADPRIRALAERADAVVAVAMFAEPLRGWTQLVLPGTSYLERDGTMVNLEGRVQRLRRAVIPPAPDELAWIAKVAERFGVELDPHATAVYAEVERALPTSEPMRSSLPAPRTGRGGPLRLVRYRPLFSGPAVERVPELQFQRPGGALELSPADAGPRGIESGHLVRVSSNGTSIELRARVDRKLMAGAVRAAEEHVRDLAGAVEVTKA